jgi:hypothetical protein
MDNKYTQEQRDAIHRRAKALSQGQQLPATDGHHAIDVQNNNVINSSTNEVDKIVGLLGEIVMRTKGLSEPDAARVRELVRVAHATLTATTCLPEKDQRLFQAALRDARNHGY